MKSLLRTFILSLSLLTVIPGKTQTVSAGIDTTSIKGLTFFKADHPYLQYTGRIDFTNKSLPRFWQPGVYIQTKFSGTNCEILINDEELWGNSHNYIQLIIDNNTPIRIKTVSKINTIKIDQLKNGIHSLTICKGTEAGIGYIELVGLRCEAIHPTSERPLRKIEFIGNSITSGMGSDLSLFPCGQGVWYDQHNAYQSYGPTTARTLQAEWQLSSVSGIGMIHSCCKMTVTMPQVFDKINMRENSVEWNFNNYQPDVVTVCLGQNDGIQDSTAFCNAYVDFIDRLRRYYPKADIICLTSPMADSALLVVMKKYLNSIVSYKNKKGDKKISSYFFSKIYNHGCGSHPDINEHQQIAKELTAFISKLKNW